MNRFCRDVLHAFIMGFVLPGVMLSVVTHYLAQKSAVVAELEVPPTVTAAVVQERKEPIQVSFPDGAVGEMALEAYLVGAVLGEMPADFGSEALKAQAVVARTYAWKARATGGKHGDGSVCTDPVCCQAYCSEMQYLTRGGTPENIQKIVDAVGETAGMVLTFQDDLIEATYFSCSGGRTEDALAVWGTDYPYLQSTDSPGEENCAYYADTKKITFDDFQQALGRKFSGSPETWLGSAVFTSGGGVDSLMIGGESYSGTDLRQRLDLRSTAFEVTVEPDGLRFDTRGYGHRVGMSQYGANAMADLGCSFEEILAHYYPGTTLLSEKKIEKYIKE